MTCTYEDSGLDSFYLRTPYSAELVEAIKKIPDTDRMWDSDLKAWIIEWDHWDYVQDAVWKILRERLVEERG